MKSKNRTQIAANNKCREHKFIVEKKLLKFKIYKKN